MSSKSATSSPAKTQNFNDDFLKPVAKQLGKLDEFLQKQLKDFESQIQDLVLYCIANQGKRLRPLLVFYSGFKNVQNVSIDLVRAAAIVEFIHIATLVHDDILDNASLRHNVMTVASKYGNTVAVLLGDALFAHAIKLTADYPTVDVCHHAALATRKVCVGEIQQTLNRGQWDISFEQYLQVVEYKTAGLFEVSCYLGAKLGGYSEEFASAARRFGQKLGIAYQVFDDLVDLWADEFHIGKTLGTDVNTGKVTLPLLLLKNKANEIELQSLKAFFQNPQALGNQEVFLNLLKHYDIFKHAKEYYLQLLNDAKNSLLPYSKELPTEHLLRLATWMETLIGKLKER